MNSGKRRHGTEQVAVPAKPKPMGSESRDPVGLGEIHPHHFHYRMRTLT